MWWVHSGDDALPSDSLTPAASPVATVCIATHRRPDGLERLLNSLAAQTEAPDFDVVVIDNDPGGAGAAVAARFAGSITIAYQIEPERGLARVRNRAVAAARGAFLAFIDDDEWADPQWLGELHRQATLTGADVVIGPVRVEFEASVAPAMRACGLFDTMPIADGEPVPWWFTRTSNAYVRRAALPSQDGPFSSEFDLTGGEDVELFWRMIDAGARVVAATGASVTEFRPARRARLGWVLRRAARDGHNKARLEWRHRPQPERRALGLAAAQRGAGEALAALREWPSSRERAVRRALAAAGELGKLAYLAGFKIEEYRHHA